MAINKMGGRLCDRPVPDVEVDENFKVLPKPAYMPGLTPKGVGGDGKKCLHQVLRLKPRRSHAASAGVSLELHATGRGVAYGAQFGGVCVVSLPYHRAKSPKSLRSTSPLPSRSLHANISAVQSPPGALRP